MEDQAILYIKQSLDKATQKGVYTLDEVANIISCLEILNKSIQNGKENRRSVQESDQGKSEQTGSARKDEKK